LGRRFIPRGPWAHSMIFSQKTSTRKEPISPPSHKDCQYASIVAALDPKPPHVSSASSSWHLRLEMGGAGHDAHVVTGHRLRRRPRVQRRYVQDLGGHQPAWLIVSADVCRAIICSSSVGTTKASILEPAPLIFVAPAWLSV